MTASRTEGMVKVVFKLEKDEEDYPLVDCEGLWARPVGEGLFQGVLVVLHRVRGAGRLLVHVREERGEPLGEPGIGNVQGPQLLLLSGHGAYANVAEAMAMAKRADQAFSGESKASDPLVVAQAIREAIDSPSPKARYVVGSLGKMLRMLNRVLPDRAWERMVTGRLG